MVEQGNGAHHFGGVPAVVIARVHHGINHPAGGADARERAKSQVAPRVDHQTHTQGAGKAQKTADDDKRFASAQSIRADADRQAQHQLCQPVRAEDDAQKTIGDPHAGAVCRQVGGVDVQREPKEESQPLEEAAIAQHALSW